MFFGPFQFTPLREGRPAQSAHCRRCRPFQFTPLREGRLAMSILCSSAFIFQFTPLREGRLQHRLATSLARLYFNSRPSARGDSYFDTVPHKATKFQFTPLREGRHYATCEAGEKRYFNSRPSARGDAYVRRRFGRLPYISIHAPPRGATISRAS